MSNLPNNRTQEYPSEENRHDKPSLGQLNLVRDTSPSNIHRPSPKTTSYESKDDKACDVWRQGTTD